MDNENDANEIVERIKNGDEFESIIKKDFDNQNTVINDLKKSDLIEAIWQKKDSNTDFGWSILNPPDI